MDTEKGLLVPVIKDAGDLSVGGLAKRIADLAARTRQNKVTPDELVVGTVTITNYGSTGTLMDTPIINQPQVAILGTGALVKRPVVITDPRLGQVIAIRDMMYLSLPTIIDWSTAPRRPDSSAHSKHGLRRATSELSSDSESGYTQPFGERRRRAPCASGA